MSQVSSSLGKQVQRQGYILKAFVYAIQVPPANHGEGISHHVVLGSLFYLVT